MKKNLLIATFLIGSIAFLFVLNYILNAAMPSQEAVQSFFENYGVWGYLFYVLFGISAVVVVPLNFSLTGIAGAFVYGFWVGVFTNWICKIIGTLIAFSLGRYFGSKLFPLFNKEKVAYFKKLMESEKAIIIFFLLSSIPFTPSDAMAYFLGCSPMKKITFIFITSLGSFGTSFTLAYIGSGQALDKPIFIVGLGSIMAAGLFWIHMSKQKLHLN
ncbi:TVP38/TMEM64 family protein [Candidatus Peregrinibacteria bacterium]|jgi:uncharacterized membrane protein YdjX (TVP38/TMEM64 family)|nr:TVP38/TMEM64 family protein [Candidatus Peregrinibacteria bacterium]MBT4631688.1 TVP38/TMEM64 family protein [Candidatus Peregrinibacteria bacterium]MBT5517117.1 TVP38/TMEM64 family protein [Candidatus Peregrinibacteria bacterium]MBT5824249.1 TVP38/TMEM64 family protein [Candidatus Peregrinibacteria bacterium]